MQQIYVGLQHHYPPLKSIEQPQDGNVCQPSSQDMAMFLKGLQTDRNIKSYMST